MSDEQREAIERMLYKPYHGPPGTRPCWSFCMEVFRLYDIALPEAVTPDIVKIAPDKVRVPSIVLFRFPGDWHAGVVWPDGLHFVHALVETNSAAWVRQDRLTCPPWNDLIEGYYVPK